jgi:hypothetical protein
MSKTRKLDKLPGATRHPSLCVWACLGLGLLPLLAGCGSTSKTHAGDPLYGEFYPKGPGGQPMPPSNQSPNKTTSAVPPIPASNSAASTAALAGGLPGGRSLAIGENSGTNWALTSTGSGVVPAGGAPGGIIPASGKAPIVQPIPRDPGFMGPVTAGNPGMNSNPGGAVVAAGSWSSGTPAPSSTAPLPPLGVVTPEVLQDTLQGKGAVGLKKENVPEGVRVSCYVPQRSDPFNLRYLETTAADYPTALQALLRQVEGS